MGSWNQTCCVSQLPINYGEDCRLIMLMEAGDFGGVNENDSQNIYATDIYQPVSFPIPVTYFDYGTCEPREGFGDCWQKEVCLSSIQDLMVDSPDEFGIEEATDRDVLGEMKVPLISESSRGLVTFNLVREDIYKELVKGSYKEKYSEEVKKQDPSEEHEDWDEFSEDTKKMFREFENKFMGSYLHKVNCYFLEHVLIHPDGNFEHPDGFNEVFGEFMQFVINMENLRKQFVPQCGGGSQSLTGEIHNRFYKKCLEISNNMQNYL